MKNRYRSSVRLSMSESEILTSYNQAKNKRDQIGILADLNATTKAVICAVLADHGCILDPLPAQQEKQPELPATAQPARAPWLPEDDAALLDLRKEGMPCKDIADKLGRTLGAIHTRISVLMKSDMEPKTDKPAVNPNFESVGPPPQADSSAPSLIPDRYFRAEPCHSSIEELSPPGWQVSKTKYSLTLCCNAADAFERGDTVSGYITLGTLKQHLQGLVYAMEKKSNQ